jgi:hypothetical protein
MRERVPGVIGGRPSPLGFFCKNIILNNLHVSIG